jgi:N-acetylmuramoyl-L-alanine amidase
VQNHGQELWLDLDRSQLRTFIEPASSQLVFPITWMTMRDFGGGRVRLIIRVRGEVDYVVAQIPHELVVRIAPSSKRPNLEQPLLAEMEQRSRVSIALAPAAQRLRPQNSRRTSAQSYPGGLSTGDQAPAKSSDQMAGQTVQPASARVERRLWPGTDGVEPLVAIDPGHGGFDPGTESIGGAAEKDVALAISRRLAAALQTRGVEVQLTRDDDRFLSLAERTRVANRIHADLFVSIHLNSSPEESTRGIETYYLNNTTDRSTIRLARIENGGDYGAGRAPNLNYILTNLQQDYKAHEASSLARMIEADVAISLDTTLGVRINTLGAKKGPFYVLVGAAMPAVLIECGFLSNPREAHLLLEDSYQQALAEGIALAITSYFHPDSAVGNL